MKNLKTINSLGYILFDAAMLKSPFDNTKQKI